MPNMTRRWLPPALIAVAAAASMTIHDRLPPMVAVPLDSLLPFDLTPVPGPAPRWLALFLMPTLALIVWLAFRLAPTAAGQRLGRRMFRDAPEAVTSPEQFERFGNTYDAIVLGVTMLFLGLHAAVLAAALERPGIASRIVPAALGGCLMLMGNVMPRLRPNWVAGLRVKRTLEDPRLWRNTHRAFGAALVVAGAATMLAAVVAPRYGMLVFVGLLLVSCMVGFVASRRKGGVGPSSETHR